MHRVILTAPKTWCNINCLVQNRFRSTLPPLYSIFNNAPKLCIAENNEDKNAGLFLVPELRDKAGFEQLQISCFKRCNDLVEEAIDESNRQRCLVQVFDDLSDNLCQIADLAEFVRIAHTNEEYVKAAAETCTSVTGIVEKLNTNKELYKALRFVVHNGDKHPETEICKRVNTLFLFDFEQNGIHFSEQVRDKILTLNNDILQLGNAFVSGCSGDKWIERRNVPAKYHKYFDGTKTHFVLRGLYADSGEPERREMGYRLYMQHDPHQERVLSELLRTRALLAATCGFRTYGERCLRGTLFDTPATVMTFLDDLTDQMLPSAQAEFEAMRQMRSTDLRTTDGNAPLPVHDVPYYAAKYKENLFDIHPSEYSPYFSLGTCMEGLSGILDKLYGIRLDHVEMAPGECWAPNVYKLIVWHEDEGALGTIYCDLFSRPGKVHQDSQFTIRGGRQLDDRGDYQMPVVVVMLNLQQAQPQTPCLLTPSLLENLFHEMGHAMHSVLGRTRYQHVTGTRCATDVAELPSVLMEYFARDPRVLRTFARHYRTGQPMPEPLLVKMCESRRILAASETQLQIFYSALDQRYHSTQFTSDVHPTTTSTDILEEMQRR